MPAVSARVLKPFSSSIRIAMPFEGGLSFTPGGMYPMVRGEGCLRGGTRAGRTRAMFSGHDPYLVVASVLVAILGGYTGFGLATRIRGTPGLSRRLLLAGAAGFLAVGIWTMHFIGMLAAPIPDDAAYLVLPTFISFLLCAVVVGISLYFVSIGAFSHLRIVASALLMGTGIVSMHYVGIHGLAGSFHIEHDGSMIYLSAAIAVGAAYGGLRAYLARHDGLRLALSAIAFGFAVSGMHYTAMHGMRFTPVGEGGHVMEMGTGLMASSQALSLVVAFLCFLIVAGFLLFLVPEPRPRAIVGQALSFAGTGEETAMAGDGEHRHGLLSVSQPSGVLPLAGLGQPRRTLVDRVPVEGAGGTHFVDAGDIRSVRADAHYTQVHDGARERMCSWTISDIETQLCPIRFMRVHRSHIVAVPHIAVLRKEGDGAVVELDGPSPHLVPVSRAKIAELKARLGLTRRGSAGPAEALGQKA
jgi:NO-binding membrane sensor protein with MHYT domain